MEKIYFLCDILFNYDVENEFVHDFLIFFPYKFTHGDVLKLPKLDAAPVELSFYPIIINLRLYVEVIQFGACYNIEYCVIIHTSV